MVRWIMPKVIEFYEREDWKPNRESVLKANWPR
jgi:hypothetical protein